MSVSLDQKTKHMDVFATNEDLVSALITQCTKVLCAKKYPSLVFKEGGGRGGKGGRGGGAGGEVGGMGREEAK